MKSRIIGTALLVTILTIAIGNTAQAGPWHGGHRGGGWYRPHVRVWVPPVRIAIPAPRVVVGGYYDGGYYGGGYYNRGYARPYCPPPAPRYYSYNYNRGRACRPSYRRGYRY